MTVVARPIPLPASSGLFGPTPGTTGFVDLTAVAGTETGGSSTVQVVIRQGSSSGPVLLALSLAAGGADAKTLNHPIRSNGQLYAVISGSGTLAGTAHVL
jgi:hypothetical protein